MASINLSGQLLDPNGDLAVGDKVRFTHKSTTGETIQSAVSVLTIPPDGMYDIDLEFGLVLVEYQDSRRSQYKNLGIATVNGTNPATSIPELLNALVPVSSAELIEFQAILADCVTAQTAAENAATTAEAFAYQLTTVDLIASTAIFTAETNIPTSGFTASGDGGSGSWKQNGVTGQTASQSPAQLGDALLNDANGNQWEKVFENTFTSLSNTFPPPKAGDTITRTAERVFFGKAIENAGTVNKLDGATFIGDPALDVNSFYLDQCQTESISYYGGIGLTSGARALDRYLFKGALGVWASGLGVTSGEKRGYEAKIYTADSTGTTGSTPPTHSSGSVSDGSINWTFVEGVEGTPIGSAAVVLQDVVDGRGAWARYTEAVRAASGGSVFAEEIVVKNKGSDIVNNPYNHLRGQIAHWFAGGGDASLGAPTNPSTAAIVIGANATTWNKGIVIAANGITGTDGLTGSGEAISLAKGHKITWFTSAETEGASMTSQVSDSAQKTTIRFVNGASRFLGVNDEINLEVQNLNSSVNYIRVTPSTTGTAVTVRAVGTDTNVDLRLRTQGAGVVRFGNHSAIGAETVTGYVTIRSDDGVSRKIAVVS